MVHKLPLELLNNLRLMILRNIRTRSNWVKAEPSASFPSKIKTFAIAIKNYAEADFKDFCSFPIFLGFFTLFKIFCQVCCYMSVLFFNFIRCLCGFCFIMVTVSMCTCCSEFDKVIAKKVEQNISCITQYPDFNAVILK